MRDERVGHIGEGGVGSDQQRPEQPDQQDRRRPRPAPTAPDVPRPAEATSMNGPGMSPMNQPPGAENSRAQLVARPAAAIPRPSAPSTDAATTQPAVRTNGISASTAASAHQAVVQRSRGDALRRPSTVSSTSDSPSPVGRRGEHQAGHRRRPQAIVAYHAGTGRRVPTGPAPSPRNGGTVVPCGCS